MRTWWRIGFTALLLAATLLATRSLDRRPPEVLAAPLESLPSQIAGWSGVANPPLKSVILDELVATSYLSRTYRRGNADLDLFVAYYAQQRAGESMHSPKHCLPGSGWEIWQYGLTDVPADGRSVQVNKYSVENNGSRRLVLYWYQSRRRIIASELQGKLLLVRDALLEGGTGGSIVRITLPDQPGALEDGVAFASALIPQMQRCLGR